MAAKTIIEGRNFQAEAPAKNLAEAGVFGVVTNVRFVRCYWPALDEPVALFADGSGGIEVQGPPTPRNVVFPPDTVFLPVVVNDAKLGEKPRWRTTEIPTKADSFFIRTRGTADVVEEEEVEGDVEIDQGQIVRAKWKKQVLVQREVERVEHMTADEARAHAARR
jgi:hypothetical protein